MANQHHLDVLIQGSGFWNQWRTEHSDIQPDLNGADLEGADLRRANLSRVSISGANLRHARMRLANLGWADLFRSNFDQADLRQANFFEANLGEAHLYQAILNQSNLIHANLNRANLELAKLEQVSLRKGNLVNANLSQADLREADLRDVDFGKANLCNADLSHAKLNRANFNGAILKGANLSHTFVGGTNFSNVDLQNVKGLEAINHQGPSSIGIDTIYLSHGLIPEDFLREVGVPDIFREYMQALITQPIQYETCFISYANNDEEFAKRLRADLQGKGVRCWFAPHDLRPGNFIRRGIDQAIHDYDKLVLILSKHAISSEWVAYEVEMALYKERKKQSEVLFPLRIDNAIMTYGDKGWAKHLLTRHIADFTEPEEYRKAFGHMLRHLKASH